MTNPDIDSLAPLDAALLIVESFIDGERVDPLALKEALARADAREHLAELLLLRETVWATAPHTWSLADNKRSKFSRSVRWFAAAAAIVVSLTTGYFAGQGSAQTTDASSGVEAFMGTTVPPLPEATRSIPLRPGVNWTETSGGR